MLWTGEFVAASEALSMGLVSEVCADDRLQERVQELASQLAAQPPVAVQLIKRAFRLGERQELRTALELISSYQAVATATADSREAMAAFKERRPGEYHGR
jgi:enoyl-CoA hydratase/carnithine racemase